MEVKALGLLSCFYEMNPRIELMKEIIISTLKISKVEMSRIQLGCDYELPSLQWVIGVAASTSTTLVDITNKAGKDEIVFLLSARGRGVELATILSLVTGVVEVEALGLLSCLTHLVKA